MNIYSTTDIQLAAYLVLKNHKMGIKFQGKEALFSFPALKIEADIKSWYEDKDQMLSYSNKLKNIKSQIINTKG